MCKQYEIAFRACGHTVRRPEYTFHCEFYLAGVAEAGEALFGSDCPDLDIIDMPLTSYCHQSLLRAVASNEQNRPGPLLEGERKVPENGADAERILRLAQNTGEVIYYDETTGRSFPYDTTNIQIFFGERELSVADLEWLKSAIEDITSILWERWEGHDLANPTLEEVTLLIHIREVYLASNIAAFHVMFLLLEQAHTMLGQPVSRADILSRLSGITVPVSLSELGEDESECIICREKWGEEIEDEPPVRLPCGHIVGFSCLRIWVESAPEPVRICTLCNQSFGILSYQAPQDADSPTIIYAALVFTGLLPGPVPNHGTDAGGALMRAVHPNPPALSPYWVRLLQNDGSVFRATSHHHKFRRIFGRSREPRN